MSKRRKITAVVGGVIIFVYIVVGATYRAVLWPVTGVNEFSIKQIVYHNKQIVYHNPQPSEFPEHTMCRMGSVSPGLGWLLGTIYAHPNAMAINESVAGNACSYKYAPGVLYVKRGNSIKKYRVIGVTAGDDDDNLVGHAEQF